MTARRYRRNRERREVSDTLNRVSTMEFGNTLPTFRAAVAGTSASLVLDRTPYISLADGGENDIVCWNYWDTTYNASFFDLEIVDVLGEDCVVDVGLKVPGLYAIRAMIDWDAATGGTDFMDYPFSTWLGTNFDEGATERYMYWPGNAYGPVTNLLNMWTMSEFVVLWPAAFGSEFNIEITAAHDHPAYTELYIPGGFGGFWAYPPMLTICYLGSFDSDRVFGENI